MRYLIMKNKNEIAQEFLSDSVTAKTSSSDVLESSSTKKGHNKLTGRNKKRPRNKIDFSTKICKNYLLENNCSYGDKCKYSHDRNKFLNNKPQDIGDKCVLLDIYGRCKFGLACRFGNSHIKDGISIDMPDSSKDGVYAKCESENIQNVLTSDLRKQLWKKTYNFAKSNRVIESNLKVTNCEKKRKLSGETANVNVDNEMVDEKSNGEEQLKNVTKESRCDDSTNIETQKPISNHYEETLDEKDNAACMASDGVHGVHLQIGCVVDSETLRQPKKIIDFKNKLFLAPLTTVGNLPFRRLCKEFGADITCGEMAVCTNLLQGQQSEWALIKRHKTEDTFGIQLCGSHVDSMTRCAELLNDNATMDFIDINCGCPIDLIFEKGEGCGLMGRATRLESIVHSMTSVLSVPLTVKMRTGIYSNKNLAHSLVPRLHTAGASLITIHGRSREQRYTKLADWSYINSCCDTDKTIPIFGNGDILSYHDYVQRCSENNVAGAMIARGALIKPWIFAEIKGSYDWDISATERLDMYKKYVNYGLEHWGTDDQGVETTRRFFLEWLSFTYRYIPLGILERCPQRMNEKPPSYRGRDDLETLLSSSHCGDWIKISEMFLGPVPEDFNFLPKHKANAYK